MLNNIDNTSFKARFAVSAPIKDSVRIKNIQKIFSENTKSYTDTLTLTRLDDFAEGFEVLHKGANPENSPTVSFGKSFNSLLEKFSDNEIATKLIKALKTIKALGTRDGEVLGLESSIYRAEHEQNRNTLIANNFREKGNETMAKRFEYLAQCYGKQVEKIKQKQQNADANFINKLNEIADGDQDILYFSNAM